MKFLVGVCLLPLTLLVGGCRERPPVNLTAPADWTAHPADGVDLTLSDDAGALRLDFAFTGGGYAIARQEIDLDLPANYMFRFRLRGEAPPNTLEFKLVDASGENVWWRVFPEVNWPQDWQTFTVKKRQISFAWGPRGGGDLEHLAAIELAVTAGKGGQGTVWIDGLEMVPMPLPPAHPPAPVARASSSAIGTSAAAVLDGNPATIWTPNVEDAQPTLELDLGYLREFGGLTVSFADGREASDYQLEAADDRNVWLPLQAVTGARGLRHHFYLPESQARKLRLLFSPATGGSIPAVAELQIQPLDWSATRNAFFMNIAAEAPRGIFPRGLLGAPTAWTVVGVDADPVEGLLGADGALESGPGGFSIEPFLTVDGQLITWNDVNRETRLVDGDLPLPQVVWTSGSWRLTITALGTGPAGRSCLVGRYALENLGAIPGEATLSLALRPFQVNPPIQFLNIRGGYAPVGAIARQGPDILVDGRPRMHLIPEPDAFGATAFQGGDIVRDYLAVGQLPAASSVKDAQAAASAAASWHLAVPAGGRAEVAVVLPLHEASDPQEIDPRAALQAARTSWRQTLDQVDISGPPAARDAIATAKAQLGYILVNRAGVRLQPGTRSYARSWIRDGALTGTALLRWGLTDSARDFLIWYAPHQYANGKIPCVVDWRGADPVPEHDSTGEFIHLVAETYRFTGDHTLLQDMWPRVIAGVAYLESLLEQRRTTEYAAEDRREFYGILPPSISHEGYSSKPMHSYWDNFFALLGLRDAAWLAEELARVGDQASRDAREAEHRRLTQQLEAFSTDLSASIPAAMARHGIDYVPGCADLGDFDPTSTTIALDPVAAADLLPPGSLETTFDRYWEFFCGRRDGAPWEAFTPYEIRNIGAFVRLGWRERAQELLTFFLEHRTPQGWRQWAEVVGSHPQHARFIGDMPHTWVGSDYARSLLDMFVYERREGAVEPAALILAAGLPETWLEEGGVHLAGLPTPYGTLDYDLRRQDGTVAMDIGGDCRPPGGGLILDPPVEGLRATSKNGRVVTDDQGRVVVRELPTRVTWVP